MSYGRLSKPSFIMDNFSWQASRGLNRNTALSIVTGAGTIALSAGTKYDMFDMNPINTATFDSLSGTTNTCSILIDMGIAGIDTDSITIMDHNLSNSGGKIRVAYSAATMTRGGGTAVAFTSVFNGAVTGDYSIPGSDGDTVLSFPSNSSRYWLVEFEDVAAGWVADLVIGMIMLGKSYTLPISPDMPVTKGTMFDGVQVNQSYGGKAFGSAGWTVANTGSYTAFRTGTAELKIGGRETFDFSIGFMGDSNIYASDRATPRASDNFLADVIDKCSGNLLPFVFMIDSASSIEGDFLYCRFDENTFQTIRKAWEVESFSLRLVQEF